MSEKCIGKAHLYNWGKTNREMPSSQDASPVALSKCDNIEEYSLSLKPRLRVFIDTHFASLTLLNLITNTTLVMAELRPPPPESRLFIATPNAVFFQDELTKKTLFECDTVDSIVNARASRDNSSLFAVADSQVVVLYDAARCRNKKYKLKSGDVRGIPLLIALAEI